MKRKIVTAIMICSFGASIATGCGTSSPSDVGQSVETSETEQASDLLIEGSQTEQNESKEATLTAEADENGNYIVNGSFEEPDFTGWTINNKNDVTEELDIYTRESDCYDGVQSLHFYSGTSNVDFTAEQSLTGLEEGTYKLTAYIQGDSAGDENADNYFYAVIDGETYKADAELNGYVNWYEVDLENLNVTDGNITIGVNITNGIGGWGTIDAITLVRE